MRFPINHIFSCLNLRMGCKAFAFSPANPKNESEVTVNFDG